MLASLHPRPIGPGDLDTVPAGDLPSAPATRSRPERDVEDLWGRLAAWFLGWPRLGRDGDDADALFELYLWESV